MNSYEYIKEVKRNNGLETDYQAAKMLGWKPHKIYQYRDGQSMDNEAARQVAEVLNIPVLIVIADMEAMRQKDPSKKKAWKMLSKMTKQSGRISTKLLNILPFLAVLSSYFVYYVKLSTREQVV